MGEISTHITEMRASLAAENELEIRQLLERLGDPAEIAAEARERFGVSPRKRTWVETTALILLSIGSIVIPVVGWFIGVVFLWISDVWNTRDKLVGTLFVPGGVGGLWLLAQTLGGTSAACVNGTCTGGSSHSAEVFWTVLLITLAVASLAAPVYLAVRMRRLTRRAALA